MSVLTRFCNIVRVSSLFQLADEKVYNKFSGDTTNSNKWYIDRVVRKAYDITLISLEVKKTWINKYPQVTVLYLLPEVHKDLENSPGHPIVLTEGLVAICRSVCRLLFTDNCQMITWLFERYKWFFIENSGSGSIRCNFFFLYFRYI